jgi:hypothetical protein
MGDEPLTKTSSPEDTPKSLHVVCSPGKGAFSVYMFLRYALAQRSDPQISEVKMTMLCREKCKAEKWWNRWSENTYLANHLRKNPTILEPVFIQSTVEFNEKDVDADITVFIFAGGDKSRLFDAFQRTYASYENVKLVTEHEIMSLKNDMFVFHSAFNDELLEVSDFSSPLTPQEALRAVESAEDKSFVNATRAESLTVNDGKSTFDMEWNLQPSFEENDPSRVQILLEPVVSLTGGTGFNQYRPLKEYFNQNMELLKRWRKSFRFSLKIKPEDLETLRDKLGKRLVDFDKILATPSHRASRYLSKNSVFFSLKRTQNKKNSTLIWLPWDRNNVGRSVQLLSLILHQLKTNECVLITSYHPLREIKTEYDENLFLQRLLSNSEKSTNLWTEGLEHIKAQELDDDAQLVSTLKAHNTIELYDIGINGPSLKESIDFVYSHFFLRDYKLKLSSKKEIVNRFFNSASFLASDRSFVRGAFSLLPREYTNMNFQELNRSKLQSERIASHLVWLHSYNRTMDHDHLKPLSFRFCAIDTEGKLILVDDNYHVNSLEIILYLALERYRNHVRVPEQKSSQHDIELVLPDGQFTNWAINPELWMSIENETGRVHSVFDAKAKDGIDAKQALDIETTTLNSKYSWESLTGKIPVYSLSYFEGEGIYSHLQAHLFPFSAMLNFEQLSKSLYSMDLLDLARYMAMFQSQTIERPLSYAEYSNNCFSVDIPRYEPIAPNPNTKQLGIEFFRGNNLGPHTNLDASNRQNLSSTPVAASDQHYSGFFYLPVPQNKDATLLCSDDDAFHFYDEPLTNVMKWAFIILGIDEVFSVSTSNTRIDGSFLRIMDKGNNEWLISVSDFLSISDLLKLGKFLKNKKGFKDYHAFENEVRRHNEEKKNLLHRVKTRLPFMKTAILNMGTRDSKSIPGIQEFHTLSTTIQEPIEELVSAVSMFQKMGCEAFDTTFLTTFLTTLLEVDCLEKEHEEEIEETILLFTKLQEYCIDSMFQLNLTSATSIDSIDENDKATYLHEAFCEKKYLPIPNKMRLTQFRREMRNIVLERSNMFNTNTQKRYDAFRDELIRRSSRSSQSDA